MIFKKDHFVSVLKDLNKSAFKGVLNDNDIDKINDKKDVDPMITLMAKTINPDRWEPEQKEKFEYAKTNNCWEYNIHSLKMLKQKALQELFFKTSAFKLADILKEKASAKSEFTFDTLNDSLYYMPKFTANEKLPYSELNVQTILARYGIFVEFVKPSKEESYKMTQGDAFFINALGHIANANENTVTDSIFLNKFASKLLAYWTYNLYIRKQEVYKDMNLEKVPFKKKSKRPTDIMTNKLFNILIQKEPAFDQVYAYIARDCKSKIRMKAYSYLHNEKMIPFNYSEIFSSYPATELVEFKKIFKISSKNTIDMFYKSDTVGSIITEQQVADWNKQAKDLIESSYFEYYKKRITECRKLRGKAKQSLKTLLQENKRNFLNNKALNSFLLKNYKKFTNEQVINILKVIDYDNYKRMTSIPEIVYSLDDSLAYDLMRSYQLDDYKSIIYDQKAEWSKNLLEALYKCDKSLFVKE